MTLTVLAGLTSAGHADDALTDEQLSRIPVKDRPHPEFDPAGIEYNSIFFYPKLTTGLRFDSNVLATQTNPRSDVALVFSPELTVRSIPKTYGFDPNPQPFWYEFNIGADIYRFHNVTTENREDAHARLFTHKEFSQDLFVDTTFEAARKHTERGDSSTPPDARNPIPYTDIKGELALTKTFNRFGVMVDGSARNLAYGNVDSINGGTLDQSWRNGTIFTGYVKPFYEFSPGYRAFVQLQANTRNYDGTGDLNRDSHGYLIHGGVDFVVSPLIFGSVAVGYLSESYDNPAIAPIDGLSFSAKATWMMTKLMTATFSAERSVDETVTPGFNGLLRTSFGTRLDYEFLRNLIIYAEPKYILEDFPGTTRDDKVAKISAGFDYLMNPKWKLGLRYDFIDRNSTIPTFTYDEHVVTFNVTTQY
ncbi:MAG: outer membrane beta-barrel protein [Pseudorhodoplanes sp.]